MKFSANKRRTPRIPIKLEVEFSHDETGVITLFTENINDTGLFIKMPSDGYPPLGTSAHVKLKNNFEDGEEPPLLEMKVIRHCDKGIGLEFIL